jgi:3-hydroxyacyl-CoA dehydrogenase, NAD binding domain
MAASDSSWPQSEADGAPSPARGNNERSSARSVSANPRISITTPDPLPGSKPADPHSLPHARPRGSKATCHQEDRGTLGQRIASVYAAGGSDVRIFDLSADQRQAARDYVTDHVEGVQRILGLDPPRTGQVELADDLADAVRGAWMVIEVVPEKLELKREAFGRLDALAESDAILASNSSSIASGRRF